MADDEAKPLVGVLEKLVVDGVALDPCELVAEGSRVVEGCGTWVAYDAGASYVVAGYALVVAAGEAHEVPNAGVVVELEDVAYVWVAAVVRWEGV